MQYRQISPENAARPQGIFILNYAVLFCLASPISLLYAGLMSRAFLAVSMHLGVKQVYAEVAVKAVALGRVCHMRHGMHACSHSLAVVCNPYGAPVP